MTDLLERVKQNFNVLIPTPLKNLMEDLRDTPDGKVLEKQFKPSIEELNFKEEELIDPIGDEIKSPVAFITHRYRDRVLLKVTYTCAVYCRYCFRRYKVSKSEENPTDAELNKALEYIEHNQNIREVILTGGDPLNVSNKKLKFIIDKINTFDHIDTIRIHTRMPGVVPSRIIQHPELLQLFKNSNKPIWMVLHINHAAEITREVEMAIKLLNDVGVTLLNQSVLLKDVNDSINTLTSLCRSLIKLNIRPYYLHYPDLAQGTHHFRMPLKNAMDLVDSLSGQLPGFAIPKLMIDLPQGLGKVHATNANATQLNSHSWQFKSPLTGELVTVTYPM